MIPPLLSYVTFNRLGLTVKSLSSILKLTDDFEMHIIDNYSTDGTWEYILSLNDERIKSKTRIGINAGQIYALNINLSKRRPDQYFITIDNDVVIETKNFITRFMDVFKKFPYVGILGVEMPYPNPRVINKERHGVSFRQIENATEDAERNYVSGCCMFIRPELLEDIGYFCEENGFGDIEICYRVNNFTEFTTGFVKDVNIQIPQTVNCSECPYQSKCTLNRPKETCFTKYQERYKNDEFKEKFKWKFEETIIDMKSGARPVYCASSNDASSLTSHLFNMPWALENFDFFIHKAN